MAYHVRITANIIIKRVVNETDTLSSLASESESMITEPSTVDSTANISHENDMDLYDDHESYDSTNSESSPSSESMLTDEDSNDSFKSTNDNLLELIEPVSHSSATSSLASITKKTRTTISKKAGLIFPVKRLYNKIKSKCLGKRVSTRGCIELAGVLEYLTAELLDISGIKTYELNKSIIVPRHVFLAVQEDQEYKLIFNHVTLPECGTLETNIPKK